MASKFESSCRLPHTLVPALITALDHFFLSLKRQCSALGLSLSQVLDLIQKVAACGKLQWHLAKNQATSMHDHLMYMHMSQHWSAGSTLSEGSQEAVYGLQADCKFYGQANKAWKFKDFRTAVNLAKLCEGCEAHSLLQVLTQQSLLILAVLPANFLELTKSAVQSFQPTKPQDSQNL